MDLSKDFTCSCRINTFLIRVEKFGGIIFLRPDKFEILRFERNFFLVNIIYKVEILKIFGFEFRIKLYFPDTKSNIYILLEI